MVATGTSSQNKSSEVFQGFIRFVVVKLISFYQKYLSSLKGYSCAYRLLHRGESCSAYVKRVLIDQDLVTAISLSRHRFHECYLASQLLSSRSPYKVVNEQVQQGKLEFSKRRKFLQGLLAGLSLPLLEGCLTYRDGNEEVCCCCLKTGGLRWEVPEEERDNH
jgi:putative component of membrane protein insertase Oxa1/YidC/SpoIIIJ protein YidD